MVGWTILVVDDEPRIRSLVKSVLERHGHRIIEASDGVEALRVWERSPESVDLLLTDIVMPGMDGLDLAQHLSSRSPRVRVLYMSGKCEIEAVQEQIRRRGFGFIRKPFDIDNLSLAVTKILVQPRRKAPVSEGTTKASRLAPAK
jgi:DNA-binding NtrC family response regulator